MSERQSDPELEPGFISVTQVNKSTLYLLAAAGKVEGNDESGWGWTRSGGDWVSNLLESAMLDHWHG
jgi:hypothetical protein